MKTVSVKTAASLPMALLISDALAGLEDIRRGHTEDAEIALAKRVKIRAARSQKTLQDTACEILPLTPP
jgi:hypothetical protein